MPKWALSRFLEEGSDRHSTILTEGYGADKNEMEKLRSPLREEALVTPRQFGQAATPQ